MTRRALWRRSPQRAATNSSFLLKNVYSNPAISAVGSINDQTQIGDTRSRETDRDYTAKIEALIKYIQDAQTRQHLTKEGDISAHSILEALNDAYKQANLARFETFRDENWSAEQLRGMVIDRRVSGDIFGLFDGTNKGARNDGRETHGEERSSRNRR